jgi:glutaconyl-CoA decarboxylase
MKKYMIYINGKSYEVEVEEVRGGGQSAAQAPTAAPSATPNPAPTPAPAAAPAPAAPAKAPAAQGSKSVTSPMPGNIWKVLVKPGDVVKSGDVLIILEAMKMENEIFAAEDAVVASVEVKEGDSVGTGDVLVTFE